MTPSGIEPANFPATYAFIKYACQDGLGFYAVIQESGSIRDRITGYPDIYEGWNFNSGN